MIKELVSKGKNERGVTAIVVALVIFPLLALTALAVDIGHLYVVHGELQNAADAGALAGARYLYNDDGTLVDVGANQIAHDAAIANRSENTPVEVNWSGGNGGDVERGHWSFITRTFTPNASTAPVDLWNVSWQDLDLNPDFINAVRVTARREGTPAASFFARILGYESFARNADAVAYIGFAGTLTPFDVDQPIAICNESILDGNKYTCNVGRMINSGGDIATNETGGWTSFGQDDACSGGTNASDMKTLVCGEGNPKPLQLGVAMATNGGEIQSAFNDLLDCWKKPANSNNKTRPWGVTLPVIECLSNNVGPCDRLLGAVEVNIVWITEGGTDPGYDNAPTEMAGVTDLVDSWSSDDPDGETRWNSFADHFNLRNVDGSRAPYHQKSIYFLPDCTVHTPAGVSGGENFGIRAEIPVLVQ